jgi:hypothetical protein
MLMSEKFERSAVEVKFSFFGIERATCCWKQKKKNQTRYWLLADLPLSE